MLPGAVRERLTGALKKELFGLSLGNREIKRLCLESSGAYFSFLSDVGIG